jgi:hypothetical protein
MASSGMSLVRRVPRWQKRLVVLTVGYVSPLRLPLCCTAIPLFYVLLLLYVGVCRAVGAVRLSCGGSLC